MLFPPTRRRRQSSLLLPPGLVALAWLLLLGCVALPRMIPANYLHQRAIIEMNLLPLHPDTAAYYSLGIYPIPAFTYPTVKEIKQFGPWQNFYLTGQLWNDYFTLRYIRNSCWPLSENPNEHHRVRVYLSAQTKYSSLIYLLNKLEELQIRKYWLDFRHEPSVLYVLGNKPPSSSSFGGCIWFAQSDAQDIHYPTPKAFNEVLAQWLTTASTSLLSPDWRSTWLLLVLLSFVSGWRVVRQWRRVAAQNIGA